MKRYNILLGLLIFWLNISGVALRIIHTNDSHGASLPYRAVINGDTLTVGGYKALEYHLNQLRQEPGRLIYLDAGDQQTGTAFAAKEYNDAVGGAVIEVFNMLDLDASIFGNHEFDHSLDNLMQLTKLADYPFISTNLRLRDSQMPPGRAAHSMISMDSLDVAILGLTLTELPEKVKAENVANIDILPYLDSISEELRKMDPKPDLVVLLTHLGLPADQALAEELTGMVDLIIGGHSHHALYEPYIASNGIPIFQAGSYLSHVGWIDLEIEDDQLVSYQNHLIPLSEAPDDYSSRLTRFVEEIEADISRELDMVIAEIPYDWIPDKYNETALSRWMAEALRNHYRFSHNPDFAILNNGGFRTRIPAGPVSLRKLNEMLPFTNYVCFFQCKGSDLLKLMEINAQHAQTRPYDICQISSPAWDTTDPQDPAYGLLTSQIDPQATYHIVSHDYVLGQWDKYLGFEPSNPVITDVLISEAIREQLELEFPPKMD